jgi:hypothetical protein
VIGLHGACARLIEFPCGCLKFRARCFRARCLRPERLGCIFILLEGSQGIERCKSESRFQFCCGACERSRFLTLRPRLAVPASLSPLGTFEAHLRPPLASPLGHFLAFGVHTLTDSWQLLVTSYYSYWRIWGLNVRRLSDSFV